MKKYNTMTVYRASAGSGKTFTLAIRYIELLISNPLAYKETLAVTFTNKATEEMKTRIMSQLYGLSHGLKDSEIYMNRTTADLGYTRQEVAKKAEQALHLILHDYSNFNVETIDAFFQRVLRNLARELELNANLRVELNGVEVEEMAVDKLIAELKHNDKVLKWIIGYIEQRMENDENWNVIKGIKEFGLKIFNQEYKENSEALNQKFQNEKFFSSYQSKLRNIIKEADDNMQAAGNLFFKMLNDNGFDIYDLSNNTKGASSYFRKLTNGDYLDTDKIFNATAQKAADSAAGWVTKANLSKPIGAFAEEHLVPYINKVEKDRSNLVKAVASAKVILGHLNELRLLNNIEEEVRAINEEANRFLLNDTQNILSELMKGSDAPFVFEKIGSRLLNIMIDEFQDTSTIQWDNFKKLLLNCMAQEDSQNLVVGDVKQSIYRWRNGDWKLLNNIRADKDLADKDIYLDNLDTNYRSEPNIILFNNEFFISATPIEADNLQADDNYKSEIIKQIYTPELVTQRFPDSKEHNGLVNITLLPAMDYDAECQELTKQYLQDLFANGAKDKDICIIVRDNSNIEKLANWLQQEFPDHTFISDEAYKLNASIAVNMLVDTMKSLSNPNDHILLAQIAKRYQHHILNNNLDDILFSNIEEINKFLPFDFAHGREQLLSLPINDMAEQLFTLFQIENLSDEAAYINAFFDQLSNFSTNNIPDIGMFTEAWDESIHNKTVKGGDLQGIRLMTIHKSKGLEFDHVIVPYCDWKLDKGNTLWCKTDVEPFNEIPVVPVNSTKIKNTIYSEEYYEEKLQNSIDNMNLLYVAFTRAGKNLFVIGKNVMGNKGLSTSTRSTLLQQILPHLAEKLEGSELTGDIYNKEETLQFLFGKLYINNTESKQSDNVFLKTAEQIEVGITKQSSKLEFRQSNKSRQFVAGKDKEPANQKYITQGTVLHSVLSKIHDSSEVDSVLNDFLQEGILSEADDNMNRNTLSRLIRERIVNNKHDIVNRWFASGIEVFNECTILHTNSQTGKQEELRPDRVVKDGDKITVIDFKFGNHNEQYNQQVNSYINLLKEMGCADVDGYLWYVYKNEIKEVK